MLSFPRFSAFLTAGTGPYPIIEGSTPAVAIALTFAIGFSPNSFAFLADIIKTADAPSEIAEEFPAVTVPETGLKTGRRAASPSIVES